MTNSDCKNQIEIIENGINIIGQQWFLKRIEEDTKLRQKIAQSNHRRRRLRHEADHEILEWYVQFSDWKNTVSNDGKRPFGETALIFALFCLELNVVKDCLGIEDVLRRIRKTKEFTSARYEIEVAANYVTWGYSVEFVTTGADRSPDLKVTAANGGVLWVECKVKDGITERNKINLQFSEFLKNDLHKHWVPKGINIGVLVKTSTDPARKEYEEISDCILELATHLCEHPNPKNALAKWRSDDGKYKIELRYLADPNESFPNGFSLSTDIVDLELTLECKEVNGEWISCNPRYFLYLNETPSDLFAAAINSFNSAKGQLPESGPGVIWIRVPFPGRDQKTHEDSLKLQERIKTDISGGNNSRINTVILTSHLVIPDDTNILPDLKPLVCIIENDTPKTPNQITPRTPRKR